MSKLTMMRGLPASGKSTAAHELLRNSGNMVRVNRDLLREMLHFNKFTGRNEGHSIAAEKALVREYLTHDTSVVVDDCNLGESHRQMWSGIAQECGAKFEVRFIDTHVDICAYHDDQREKSVGRQVINSMALQYGLYPQSEKGFVLCDLDGTLCNSAHRLHFVQGEKKDWNSFHAALSDDTLRASVYTTLCQFIEKGYLIVLVTGRGDEYRESTVRWLEQHVGRTWYIALFMRPAADHRPDVDIKEKILKKYFIKPGYKIHCVIDDRPKIIRMWRSHGIDVVDVGAGVEF